jgi:phosphatidylserine decarboxylase
MKNLKKIKEISIHREGYKTLTLLFLFLSGINLIASYWIVTNQITSFILFTASAVLFLFTLYFFRNPARKIITAKEKIMAPADGEVVAIEEVFVDEYFKDKRIQVSVFMSPFNVHVNWNPVSGLVRYFKYHPGKFLVAWLPKSSSENERTTLVIETPCDHQVMIRQIAGFVARRIVNYPRSGETVEQGGQFGFIKFGSRVDLLLPMETKINVKLNQKVKGAQTVIGEF